MAQCPKCRWINRDDAVKCANCAADLRAQQATQQYQPPQQPTVQGGQQHPQQPYGQQPYSPPPPGQPPYGQPGYQQYSAAWAQSVPDNLVWSILVTLFCCVPLGVVAIVKACEANSKRSAGDYGGAMQAYNSSRTLTYWSVGVGLVWMTLYFVFGFLSAMRHMGFR